MAPMLSQSLWSGGRKETRSNASQNASQNGVTNTTKNTQRSSKEQAKGVNRLLTIVGNALNRLSLSAEEQGAWEEVQRGYGRSEKNTESSSELHQLQTNIKELTATVAQLVNTKPSSWAQVAALTSKPLARASPRKAREMLVTCSPSGVAGKPKTAAEAVQAIRSQPGGGDLIAGARKLPSGAFALTFKSIEAKRAWQERGSLTATFGETAQAKETTLDVIAFGFSKGAISGSDFGVW